MKPLCSICYTRPSEGYFTISKKGIKVCRHKKKHEIGRCNNVNSTSRKRTQKNIDCLLSDLYLWLHLHFRNKWVKQYLSFFCFVEKSNSIYFFRHIVFMNIIQIKKVTATLLYCVKLQPNKFNYLILLHTLPRYPLLIHPIHLHQTPPTAVAPHPGYGQLPTDTCRQPHRCDG